MALVVFNHETNWTESLKLDERFVSMYGKDLRIKQRWKADGKGGSVIGFGASVYPACILLVQFFESDMGNEFIRGKRCLELGTGVGLGSIAAVLGGAMEVTCTDGDDSLLSLIEENSHRNLNRVQLKKLKIKRLLWDCKEDYANLGDDGADMLVFDVIFASDIVACPYTAAYSALLNTFLYFCGVNPSCVILISYKRRQETESVFWDKFKEIFDVQEVSPDLFPGEFQGSQSMGICECKWKSPPSNKQE
jgi:16S rRNA G966 N2-methylase RsmD